MRRMTLIVIACWAAVAGAEEKEKKFRHVDLQPQANKQLTDNLGSGAAGNTLALVPAGEQEFGGVKFKVDKGLIQLGSTALADMPQKVAGIKVDGKCSQFHILHATCFGGGPNVEGSELFVKDGTLIGEYTITYEDKSTAAIPIVYGEDVRDWFYVEGEKEPARGKVAWKGENVRSAQVGAKIRLYSSAWKNPKPDLKILSVDYHSQKDATVAAPFCLALTLEE